MKKLIKLFFFPAVVLGLCCAPAFGFGPCGNDLNQFCSDISPGGGRIIACLQQHIDDISPRCRAKLARYAGPEETQVQPQGNYNPVKSVQQISNHGGRVDWSFQNFIAFDRLDDSGYYNVYIMRHDGSGVECVTCNRDAWGLPHKNVGNPAWDPSGRYMVVQVEKDQHADIKRYFVSPGGGVFNDLWILDLKSGKAYMVAEVPAGKGHGVLHPHFSFDGKRLSWSELYKAANIFKASQLMGYYNLKVADFKVGDQGPRLEHVQAFEPDGEAFYENHGFSPDGTKLIFSHNGNGTSPLKDNIYTMDIATGTLAQQLTNGAYNEHALYSPDGSKIVWMTTMGNDNKGTDYWLMNADGSNKIRLTYFNQPGHPEYTGKKSIASDSSWSPDGKQIIGYVQVGSMKTDDYEERNYVITLN